MKKVVLEFTVAGRRTWGVAYWRREDDPWGPYTVVCEEDDGDQQRIVYDHDVQVRWELDDDEFVVFLALRT